jgi:5-methylthioadenosine/S-adenosylhomocysteine deaminase
MLLRDLQPGKAVGPCLIRNLDLVLGNGQTIKDGFLRLENGRISAVGEDRDAGPQSSGFQEISGAKFLAIPGLINAHSHAAMGFFRGLGHGRSNMIESFLFPTEKSLIPEIIEPLSWSYLLGGLLSGVTCFADHYYFVGGVGSALEKLGMRGVLGETVADLGGAFPDSGAEKRGREFIENWNFSDRITAAVAPHAADTVSKPLFKRLVALAKHHDLPLHLHLSQTSGERERVLRRENLSPVQYAEKCGVLGPKTLAVHLISADESDFRILKDRGVTVGYCPASQLIYEKLAPIAEFRRHSIPVAIGTDCAASNDTADLLSELRLTQFLDLRENRELAERNLPRAICQITSDPAKVLGLEKTCGQLKSGLSADVVFIEKTLDLLPTTDLNAILHYSTSSAHVRHVMVAGDWVLWNRLPVKMSIADMEAAYTDAVNRLHRENGLGSPK